MILDKLWIVSHKEGTVSPTSIKNYTNFVVGCRQQGLEPTDGYTLSTDEQEAHKLAKRYETLNQLNTILLTMDQKQLDVVVDMVKDEQ